MAQSIVVPSGDRLEFPDGMPDSEIEKAIHAEYPDLAPKPSLMKRAGTAMSGAFAPGEAAAPGEQSRIAGLMDAEKAKVADRMQPRMSVPGSVLDQVPVAKMPATDSAAIDNLGVPVTPEFMNRVRRQMDAAAPEQRAVLASRPDMFGRAATEILRQQQDIDQTAGGGEALTGKTAAVRALDTRKEARSAALARQGLDPQFAAGVAEQDAARGGDQMLGGVDTSNFDFETAAAYKDANPIVKGAAAGVTELGKQGVAIHTLINEALGRDEMADKGRAAWDALGRKSEAINNDSSIDVTTRKGSAGKYLSESLGHAVTSVITNAPGLALSFATGGGGAGLMLMAGQVGADEVLNGRKRGLSNEEAITRGVIYGWAEAVGEKFGLDSFKAFWKEAAKGVKTSDLPRFLAEHLKKEIPGELLTTNIEYGTDVGYGLEKPNLENYLKQNVDTVVQTLMQGGMMSAGGKILQKSANAIRPEQDLTAGVQFNPAAIDAYARQQLDPANAQMRQVGTRAAPVPPQASTRAELAAVLSGNQPVAEILAAQAPAAAPQATPQAPLQPAAFGWPDIKTPAVATLPDGQIITGQIAGIQDSDGQPMARFVGADGQVWMIQPGEADIKPAPAGDGTRAAPVQAETAEHVKIAEQAVNTDPSEAQKEAGNYQLGHLAIQGLDIAIENPAGSVRSGVGKDGKPWSNTLNHTYGYIKGATAADGDKLDAFIGPDPQSQQVFVIDQIDPDTGRYDEGKVILGASSIDEARNIYLSNYDAGWKGLGDITPMVMPAFKAWIAKGETHKPLAYDQKAAIAERKAAADTQKAGEAYAAEREKAVAAIGEDQVAAIEDQVADQNAGQPTSELYRAIATALKAEAARQATQPARQPAQTPSVPSAQPEPVAAAAPIAAPQPAAVAPTVEWAVNKKAKSETLAYINGELMGGVFHTRSPGTSDWGWKGMESRELHFTQEKAMAVERDAVLKRYERTLRNRALDAATPTSTPPATPMQLKMRKLAEAKKAKREAAKQGEVNAAQAAEAVKVEPQAPQQGTAEVAHTTGERRNNLDLRQRFDAMAPEEKSAALADLHQKAYVSDLTGLLNKRAFEEHVQANPADHVLYGDVDGLKALNTRYGHNGADQLLKAVGEVKAAVAGEMGVNAFHRSGDEFLATHPDASILEAYGREVQRRLDALPVEVTRPDGSTELHVGIGLSYGVGKNDTSAETRANTQKAERKAGKGNAGAVPGEATGRNEDNQGRGEEVTADVALPEERAYTKGQGQNQPVAKTWQTMVEADHQKVNDRPVAPKPAEQAYTKEAATRIAANLTRNGSPSEAYPHPTQAGMWAIGVPGEQEAAPVEVAPPTPESPAITKIKDAYGRTHHVRQSDLDNEARTQLPLYSAAGKRIDGTIHRENIDLTGEKLAQRNAENADNSLLDVITADNDRTFKTEAAAKRRLGEGYADTHVVAPASQVQPDATGFVLVRKPGEEQPADAGADFLASNRAEFRHEGFRIYPISIKGEPRWAVQSLDNSEKEKKGERQIGGDAIVDTPEQAKQQAESQVTERGQKAERQRQFAEQDAAEEAKKEANRGLSITQRRANAALDKPTNLPVNAGVGRGTRREAMESAVSQERAITAVDVADTAAHKRDEDEQGRLHRAGYGAFFGNDSHPQKMRFNELSAKLKNRDNYQKKEYRLYMGRDTEGSFYDITKTEYDYAQTLIAAKKAEASTPAPSTPTAKKEPWQYGELEYGDKYIDEVVLPQLRKDLENAHGGKFQEYKSKAAAVRGLKERIDTLENHRDAKSRKYYASLDDHYAAVRRALAAGKDVPPVAYESYDDLKADVSAGRIKGDGQEVMRVLTPKHIEAGKTETATVPVIAASIKESAKNTPMNIEQAREWLLKQIDAAMIDAKSAKEEDVWDRAEGKVDLKGRMDVKETIGYKVFDVPGDGRFSVLNLKESLQKFKKQVAATPGFKKNATRPMSVANGSGGKTSVRDMLEDGEYVLAADYGRLIGEPLLFGAAIGRNDHPVAYTNAEPVDIKGVDAQVGREWNQTGKAFSWRVIETTTGAMISSGTTKERAVSEALAKVDEHGVDKLIAQIKGAPKVSQSELERQFTDWGSEEEAKAQKTRDAVEQQYHDDLALWQDIFPPQKGDNYAKENGRAAPWNLISDIAALAKEAAEAGKGAEFVALIERRHSNNSALAIGARKALAEAGKQSGGTDYMGFERTPTGNGNFTLKDGNLLVKVEAMGNGKFQASHLSAKSSPHIIGEQGAVDWAANIRGTGKPKTTAYPFYSNNKLFNAEGTAELPKDWIGVARSDSGKRFFYLGQENGERSFNPLKAESYEDALKEAEGLKNDKPVIPEGYREVARGYFGGTVEKPIYAPFSEGERVRFIGGHAGQIQSFIGGPVTTGAIIKYDNGLTGRAEWRDVEAVKKPAAEQPEPQAQPNPIADAADAMIKAAEADATGEEIPPKAESDAPARVAETPDQMFDYLRKTAGGVVAEGKILYPAIKVIGMGGTFQWYGDKVSKLSAVGEVGTIQPASKSESADVMDALEKDQAQIVLLSHWGGSGRGTGQKVVKVLHSPRGMEYKSRDEWLAKKPAPSQPEPQAQPNPIADAADAMIKAAEAMKAAVAQQAAPEAGKPKAGQFVDLVKQAYAVASPIFGNDIYPAAVQNDWQKLLDAMDGKDGDALAALEAKYRRDGELDGMGSGTAGAGPAKVNQARRGAAQLWRFARSAMDSLKVASEGKPAATKEPAQGAKKVGATQAPKLGTQMDWREFGDYLSSVSASDAFGNVSSKEKREWAAAGESWQLLAVDPKTLDPVPGATPDTSSPIIVSHGDVLDGRSRRAEATANKEKAIAAWVASDEKVGAGETATKERFEYPNPKYTSPSDLPAMRAVVDYMNGDITRDAMTQIIVDSGLPEGTIRSITNRLGEDSYSNGEIADIKRRQAAAKEPDTGIAFNSLESDQQSAVTRAIDRAIAQESEPQTDTKRGAGWLKIKLRQAQNKGDLSAKAVEMVEWLVKQNPALVKYLAVAVENPKALAGFNSLAYNQDYVLPNRNLDGTLDAATLRDLRREAAGLESPERGTFLTVTDDGRAVATGQPGTRIPETFTGFAEKHGLTFDARRIGPNKYGSDITAKSKPMPIQYRESGAMYFGESGAFIDRTGKTRFDLTTGQASGNYNPLTQVMTLFRGNTSDTTAIHEILHHLERMMPAEMQAEIRKEWLRAVTSELQKAQKSGDQKRIGYFEAVLAGDQKKATELLTGKGMDGFNAPISDATRAKRIFHSTSTEAAALKILEDGEIRPPDNKHARGKLAPVVGRTYVSPSLETASIYSLGGVMMGSDYNWQGRTDRAAGQYGYIFEIDPSSYGDVQPDEDSVGELAANAMSDANRNSELRWLADLAQNLGTPNQIRDAKFGEYAAWAQLGKKLVKHMSDAQKTLLIDKHGADIANQGPLKIARAWKVDKSKSKEIARDGSNVLDVAEQVYGDQFNAVEPAPTFKAVDTESKEFKEWSGGAPIKSEGFKAGEAVVVKVYHGTSADITEFDPSLTQLVDGIFTTPNAGYASSFARGRQGAGNVMPLYVRFSNPRVIDVSKGDYYNNYSLESAFTSNDNDGIIVIDDDGKFHVAIAKTATQIKSSVSNTGAFDPTNPDIRQDLAIGQDYQYLNPSEFWAVRMTSTMADRFEAKSIWARSLQWLREALEHIKGALGLKSDHPLLKALDDLIKNGTGEFQSKEMLGSSEVYASIEESGPEEVAGVVMRDVSLAARLLLHPRQIAANHKPFVPVFDTAIKQFEERDRIVSGLGEMAKPYFELTHAQRLNVNKIVEQGRLDRTVYTVADLENGIHHAESGDLVVLNAEEIGAYKSLRRTFNEALSLFRDTMLEEFGFAELIPEQKAAAKLRQMIADGEIEESRIEWAKHVAKAIDEIEQAKRTGYAPFNRYGQFVVAVKALPAGVEVKDDDGKQFVTGIPEYGDDPLTQIVTDLGGQYDVFRDGWVIDDTRKAVLRALETTLFATKVEVNAFNEWRKQGKDVTDIPEVKAAFDEAKRKYGKAPNARVLAFHITEKAKADDANLSTFDELARISDVDVETWDAVREKLQEAIKAKSFRKHFFGSDNTPGYSVDFERSVADYIIGMSGYLARRKHVKDFDNAIKRIKAPALAKYAEDYRKYVNSPADEFALLKNIGFLYYIAGSTATAVANLTQVPMLTMPTLVQFVPHHIAAREVARAWGETLAMLSPTKTGLQMFDPAKVPADVRDVFKTAWEDQLFVPLETLDLMAASSIKTVGGRRTMRALSVTTQAIAYMFMFAERLNRITTFIAAARISRMKVAKDRMRDVVKNDAWARHSIGGRAWGERNFAEWAVDESQYRMGKVNRPTVMRGVGSPLLQFKGYMIQTLEAGYRMAVMHGKGGKPAALAALAMMLMLGGLWVLPGLEDLRDMIEKLYKASTGKDLDLKTEIRQLIARETGSASLAAVANKGIPYATVGVDMSRVGLGNIIPDSALQVAGIPVDLTIARPMRAAEKMAAGKTTEAMSEFLPNFLKNPAMGLQWKRDGLRDKYGSRMMTPGEFDYADVAIKSLGWTPTKVTNRREYTYAESRAERGIDELKRRYTNDLVRAYVHEAEAKDPAEKAEYKADQVKILARIEEHNKTASPENLIKLDPGTLRRKAAAEFSGSAAREGKERKLSRGAAQDRRELFQLNR